MGRMKWLGLALCFAAGVSIGDATAPTTRWKAADGSIVQFQFCAEKRTKPPTPEPLSSGGVLYFPFGGGCQRYETVQLGMRSDGVLVWRKLPKH